MEEQLAPETGDSARRAHVTELVPRSKAGLAWDVVSELGGRFSVELGIDVDAGEAEVERWFLAATLFGTRISAVVAERTFRALGQAGLVRISQARNVPSDELVALLDAGGYARYDFRTTERLVALCGLIDDRYQGRVSQIGRMNVSYAALRAALLALPGWGPVTVGLFLRELRGVWPGAQPPLDPRAVSAALHLGLLEHANGCAGPLGAGPLGAPLLGTGPLEADPLGVVVGLAMCDGFDARDLEGGLVRLTLAHRRLPFRCQGGRRCLILHQDRHAR
jgi:hypothetical protein